MKIAVRLCRWAVLCTACLGLVFGAAVVAPGSLAGVEGNGNNGYPFSIGAQTMRYQQVYDSSQFAAFGGPRVITGIAFRPDLQTGGAFSTTLSSVQIDLSTTAVTPGTMSTTFANNVGGNNTTVFSGALSISSSFTGPGPKNFDIIINLLTPFTYDPGLGNLLLDVRNFGGGLSTQFDSTNDSTVQRVFAGGSTFTGVGSSTGGLGGGVPSEGGPVEDRGLVTEFIYTPAAGIPEPSTFSLVALALAGFLAWRRR